MTQQKNLLYNINKILQIQNYLRCPRTASANLSLIILQASKTVVFG